MRAPRFLTAPCTLAMAVGMLALTSAVPVAARTRVSAGIVDQTARPARARLVARFALGYRKGRPVRLRVVTLGLAEVEMRTARAFLAMRASAARSGIDLGINSGYRTQEQQAFLHLCWRNGWGNTAARPGYSKHQSGRALDLDVRDPATFAWLARHARRFGFRRTVRSEPWHWEHIRRPARKSKRSTT